MPSTSDHDPGDHMVSKTEFVTRLANNSAFMEPVARGLFFDLDMDKNGQLEARDTQLYFDKIDQNGMSCLTALCSTGTVRHHLQISAPLKRYVLPYSLCSTRTVRHHLQNSAPLKRYVLTYSALFYQNGTSCLTALCSTGTVRPDLQRSVLPERSVITYRTLLH